MRGDFVELWCEWRVYALGSEEIHGCFRQRELWFLPDFLCIAVWCNIY